MTSPDATGAIPPTAPGPVQRRKRLPRWPGVLGVVIIVWGAFSLILRALGVALIGLFQGGVGMFAPAPFSDTYYFHLSHGVTPDWQRWWLWLSVLDMTGSAVLITAGTGLVYRRRWAVRLSRVWAIFKLLLEAAFLGVAMLMSMEDQVVDVLFMLVGIALPVFLLIWFSRPGVKREIASWVRSRRVCRRSGGPV